MIYKAISIIFFFFIANLHAADGPIFSKNSDGTIKDEKSGALWYEGTAELMKYVDASNAAIKLNLGSCNTWRIPSIDEIKGIVDPETEMFFKPFRNDVSSLWSSTTKNGKQISLNTLLNKERENSSDDNSQVFYICK
jgi:hypothetical protein